MNRYYIACQHFNLIQSGKKHCIITVFLNSPMILQMSTLLFSLRGVPEDEAGEVRDLLTANELDYYETSAGNWGISMPAIWLINNEDLSKARQLLAEYQQQRMLTQQKKADQTLSFVRSVKEKPLRFIVYLSAMLVVLYVSIKMVFEFGLEF